MDTFSPTAKDTMRNRLRELSMFGTVQFNQRVATEIMISMDKNHAQVGTCTKYIGKVVEAGVAGGLSAGSVPMASGIGKFSGMIIGELVKEVDKTKKHKKAKKIEKIFEGFDPEEETWIKFILQCFAEIFMT